MLLLAMRRADLGGAGQAAERGPARAAGLRVPGLVRARPPGRLQLPEPAGARLPACGAP